MAPLFKNIYVLLKSIMVKKQSFLSLSRSDYATFKPILSDSLDDKSFKIDFVAGDLICFQDLVIR